MNDVQVNQDFHGLTRDEASKRIAQYGLNLPAKRQKHGFIFLILSRLKDPLVILLLIASLISAITGSLESFVIILTIIFISVALNSFLEFQSQSAAEKLQKKVAVTTTVVRDGQPQEMPLAKITVGDLVILKQGSLIPADLKVMAQNDLHVDESSLTGESFPVQKKILDPLYMGTFVSNGEGKAVVAAVGEKTQFNRLTQTLSFARPETDCEKGLKKFGLLIMKLTVILTVFIFISNAFLYHDLLGALTFALALAVGLTPELLPLIVTFNLARGASEMSKKGVIVKHLPSIQNLGSMNILCADKTGTLTENKVSVVRYEDLTGKENLQILKFAFLNSRFQSNSTNPLDDAILARQEMSSVFKEFQKRDEIPFDFFRRRLSVVLKTQGQGLMICKGAPDSVLAVTTLSTKQKETMAKRVEQLGQEGYRVLAIAYKELNQLKDEYTKEDEKDLSFLGLLTFLDPPKRDVKEILLHLQKMGIQLKILTGDSPEIAARVCQELNFPVNNVLTGEKLSSLSAQELAKLVIQTQVFARVNPDQKTLIIKTLRSLGNVVGYMGDGINDVSSLRVADVSISVNNAVDVAKETADIILLKKSLAAIRDGIADGRKTFGNVTKYLFMAMGSNLGQMFSMSVASLVLPFIPMLPAQILLNNLLYDFSMVAIPLDKTDPEYLTRPQRWDMNFIKRFTLIFGPSLSVFDFLTFGVLLLIFRSSVATFQTGWFVETTILQQLIILALRTRHVPFLRHKPNPVFLAFVLITALSCIIIPLSPLAKVFGFASLPGGYWLYLALVIVAYFTLVEILKKVFQSFIYQDHQ